MKKNWITTGAIALALSLAISTGQAAEKREKFGADKRHEEIQKELKTIKPSTETFRWKMVMPWSKGLRKKQMRAYLDAVRFWITGK